MRIKKLKKRALLIFAGLTVVATSFLGLSGCIMMKLSEPTTLAPEASARIGRYEVRHIVIENAGLNQKSPATQFMNINVDALRSECNKKSDGDANCVPITVHVRRMSCSDMGFFTGIGTILGGCTLGILPLYEPSIFKYEIGIMDAGESVEIIGSVSTGFYRWHCITLLPIPWLINTSSSDYYWIGSAGKPMKDGRDCGPEYWVTALGIYEKQVIKDAIIKYLSSPEMQNLLEKRKEESLKREALRKEEEAKREALHKERIAKIEAERRLGAEKRRLAEEEAEKRRIARGPVVADFFGIPLGKDVSQEMRELGVFSESTDIPGLLSYFLGREDSSFRRELSGSHTYNGFRICYVLTDGETNGVLRLFAEEKDLAKSREEMVSRSQRHIDEIAKTLNYKDTPLHTGGATEHKWTWFAKELSGQSFAVQLYAKACGTSNAYWSFALAISDNERAHEMIFNKDDKRQKPKEEESTICTGTGWFVQSNILVTCEHVVHNAKEITFCDLNRVERPAKVLAASEAHDLALLVVDGYVATETLPIKTHLEKMATHVFTIGYPFSDLLGSNQKYTDGVISATAGLAGDTSCYQISVPIQPGNSGGALVNDNGEVVGVTSSALNALITAQIKGTIPQNVNYAIKSRYIVALLEDNGIPYQTKGTGQADIVGIGNATVLLKVQR